MKRKVKHVHFVGRGGLSELRGGVPGVSWVDAQASTSGRRFVVIGAVGLTA